MIQAVRGIIAAALACLLVALGDHAKAGAAPLPLLALTALAAGMCTALALRALFVMFGDRRRARVPDGEA